MCVGGDSKEQRGLGNLEVIFRAQDSEQRFLTFVFFNLFTTNLLIWDKQCRQTRLYVMTVSAVGFSMLTCLL